MVTLAFFIHSDLLQYSEAAGIQVVKLQETLKRYPKNKEQFLLSTKGSASGQKYATCFWMKLVSWGSNYATFLRIARDPS